MALASGLSTDTLLAQGHCKLYLALTLIFEKAPGFQRVAPMMLNSGYVIGLDGFV